MDASLQKQITTVQSVLGKYVKKPPLAEKHLMRPPFRFLHDIVMAVMQSTGFYQGLFTSGEIDSSALNTKEEKTQFLQKVISVTALATGGNVEAKVSKILAGQDAEKTLDLLVLLGGALDRGLSSKDAVDIILGGDVVEKKRSEPKKSEKKTSSNTTPSTGAVTKSKDVAEVKSKNVAAVKKNPYGAGKTGPIQSTNQKQPTKQIEKDKSSKDKDKSSSKLKSPGSKPSSNVPPPVGGKVTSHEEEGIEDETIPEKREESRSRSNSNSVVAPPLRRGSKEKERSRSEVKVKEKQASNENLRKSSRGRQSSSRGNSTTRVTTNTVENIENPTVLDLEDVNDREIFVKNEEDSIQFMGEVESLLQEHGIQIDAEKLEKNDSIREKKKSDVSKIIDGKQTMSTQGQENDKGLDEGQLVLDDNLTLTLTGTDNIFIPDDPPEPAPLLKSMVDTVPTGVTAESDPAINDLEIQQRPMTATKKPTQIQKKMDSSSENDTSRDPPTGSKTRPPSSFIRPSSARPAPPRPKTAVVEEEVVIYRPPTTKIPVILDSEEVEEEDEILNVKKQGLLDLLATNNMAVTPGVIGSGDLSSISGKEGKGHLVEQIIETKRELEFGGKDLDQDEIRNRRAQTQGELEKLKALIQSSARLANPLGRLMDVLQEDMDSMTTEYMKYKTESKRLKELLVKEKEKTRELLKPRRKELMDLMDKLEQQNFEIRAAHNDLHAVEEHLNNYIMSIESGSDKVEIPTQFDVKGWEFDMDIASMELSEMEQKAKPRHGPFGDYPEFLCLSAEVREQEKTGGEPLINIPKPKRKQQPITGGLIKKEIKNIFQPPTFAMVMTNENEEIETLPFGVDKVREFGGTRRRSSQFLEPPELELNSLEVLNEK